MAVVVADCASAYALCVSADAHEVRGTASGRTALHHSRKGTLHYEYTSYQSNDPALKLIIYTPVAPPQ